MSVDCTVATDPCRTSLSFSASTDTVKVDGILKARGNVIPMDVKDTFPAVQSGFRFDNSDWPSTPAWTTEDISDHCDQKQSGDYINHYISSFWISPQIDS